jgi:rhamnosyltransferase
MAVVANFADMHTRRARKPSACGKKPDIVLRTLETLSLVVRCFNEEAHIGRLLTGVFQQTRVPDEIIVVDSGSTDATLPIVSAFDVKIMELAPESFSFGRALNIGLATTTTDVAILASAHVYPLFDTWVEHLTGPFSDSRVALTYGRQQTPPDGRFSEQRLMSMWYPAESDLQQGHPFCNNANAAIRRSAWEIRPYDEDLTGLEDLDWAKAAMKRGETIAYVAEAPVAHVHDETFKQVMNRYRREAIAHKEIYSEQGLSMLAASRLAAANMLSDYRGALEEGRFRESAVDIARFRTAQFAGTYQGFAQTGPVPTALKKRFYYPSSTQGRRPSASTDIGRQIDYGRSTVPK